MRGKIKFPLAPLLHPLKSPSAPVMRCFALFLDCYGVDHAVERALNVVKGYGCHPMPIPLMTGLPLPMSHPVW